MELSSDLLKVLVCPITKGPLTYNRQSQELVSEMAGLAFPIRDGIPILLVDEARKVNKNAYKPISSKADYITSAQTDKDANVENLRDKELINMNSAFRDSSASEETKDTEKSKKLEEAI